MTALKIAAIWLPTSCILAPLIGRLLARSDAAYRRHEAELTARAWPEPSVAETRARMRAQLIDDLAGDFAREVDFRLADVVQEWSR